MLSHSPTTTGRLPARLRAARALALLLGTITALGSVAVAVTESDAAYEFILGALILVLALAWLPVALRLTVSQPRIAQAAVALAALGVAHAVFDVLVAGWYSSAIFGVWSLAIGVLVAPYARARQA
jgi:hypothetical protein